MPKEPVDMTHFKLGVTVVLKSEAGRMDQRHMIITSISSEDEAEVMYWCDSNITGSYLRKTKVPYECLLIINPNPTVGITSTNVAYGNK